MNGTEVTVKSIPPAIAAGWALWGFTLNEWAAIAGIFYSVLMTFFLLKDRYTKWKKERNDTSK